MLSVQPVGDRRLKVILERIVLRNASPSDETKKYGQAPAHGCSGVGPSCSSRLSRQALCYTLIVLPFGQHRVSLRACLLNPNNLWEGMIVVDEKERLVPRQPAMFFPNITKKGTFLSS
jgi:hypothetical protein